MELVKFNNYRYSTTQSDHDDWLSNMAEMLEKYLRGEPIYVTFDTSYEPKRQGSIGRLVISNVQDLLHGTYSFNFNFRGQMTPRQTILEIPENVKKEHLDKVQVTGKVVWDGRQNKVQFHSYICSWVKDRKPEEGTVWAYAKPDDKPTITPMDKLGREIKVGDFISYILYHFGTGHNAAGIFYGKVTKITVDGTVYAKNIKLADDDPVAEKRIKDNSLIVIMTKDLMDKLMLARLSIL